MAVRDPKNEWLRVKIYRSMTSQQRILLAAQMYEDGIRVGGETSPNRQIC